MNEKKFTHLDGQNKANFVDISNKAVTHREAKAQTSISVPKEIIDKLNEGDIQTAKGPIFNTATIAGINACKMTSNLIPLCHPLPINKCKINIDVNEQKDIVVTCTVSTDGRTGVEMEALTACSIAALTIYDMCKGFSHDIIIKNTFLVSKSGGKNDFQRT